jgi:hypothetical protein
LILQRGGSPTGKPFEATVGQNKRTFYHLPLEYLNPAYRDSWMLKTNYATYQIRFSE